ncbi:hypothetical protein F4861DRAFT_39252 [Xylaria intraflava]|nr:hypothetical protein F4861DRAFT_39252 [Xylaria intraflava]
MEPDGGLGSLDIEHLREMSLEDLEAKINSIPRSEAFSILMAWLNEQIKHDVISQDEALLERFVKLLHVCYHTDVEDTNLKEMNEALTGWFEENATKHPTYRRRYLILQNEMSLLLGLSSKQEADDLERTKEAIKDVHRDASQQRAFGIRQISNFPNPRSPDHTRDRSRSPSPAGFAPHRDVRRDTHGLQQGIEKHRHRSLSPLARERYTTSVPESDSLPVIFEDCVHDNDNRWATCSLDGSRSLAKRSRNRRPRKKKRAKNEGRLAYDDKASDRALDTTHGSKPPSCLPTTDAPRHTSVLAVPEEVKIYAPSSTEVLEDLENAKAKAEAFLNALTAEILLKETTSRQSVIGNTPNIGAIDGGYNSVIKQCTNGKYSDRPHEPDEPTLETPDPTYQPIQCPPFSPRVAWLFRNRKSMIIKRPKRNTASQLMERSEVVSKLATAKTPSSIHTRPNSVPDGAEI